MKTDSFVALAAGFAAVLAVTSAGAADLHTHKTPLVEPPPPAAPQFQFYVRGEVGGSWFEQNRGSWTGPGPGDPAITEALSAPASFTGGAAAGVQFLPGLRADLSYDYLGNFSVHGNPIAPGGAHASMDGGVTSNLLMANLFVEPFSLMNVNTGFVRPFVTGGIGVALNDMGDWTRTNLAVGTPVRTFSGASQTNFAWDVGGGLSFDIASLFHHAAFVDLTYRFVDAGHVTGGAVPVSDTAHAPRQAFNYELTANVATVGLRIPF
jgi:opacity protein-like surface antigen